MEILGEMMEFAINRLPELDRDIEIQQKAVAEVEGILTAHRDHLNELLVAREELARFVDDEGEADGCDN